MAVEVAEGEDGAVDGEEEGVSLVLLVKKARKRPVRARKPTRALGQTIVGGMLVLRRWLVVDLQAEDEILSLKRHMASFTVRHQYVRVRFPESVVRDPTASPAVLFRELSATDGFAGCTSYRSSASITGAYDGVAMSDMKGVLT